VSCEVKNKSLHGYLDGELDVVRAAEFEQHLETCPECLAELESQESLRASLQQAQLRQKAPAALRKRVLHELPRSQRTSQFAAPPPWLAIAAALLLMVAAAGWRVLTIRSGATAQAGLSAEIIDAHVRSLQPGHLVDVLSTDQHTVKPWFNGKMDFAVPVHDFSDEGFPLQGGRLDVIQGRTVAALIYGRRKHEVNLFIWPENRSGDENARSSSSRGYQWISWRKGGMEYWLVSDLGLPDLEILQRLVAQ
jgi:mycothiol system anti-sigma-R factor